ncbi:uncharacterized protein TNIN_452851 [Trichonephila inaurata madagascariensis]|uniref:Uncharacterized protein n=1 Tax=Trichonephila inaurata madagascariensis TaxID=2747483 RepID=A0A8X6YX59_9ARAC|nr:uncharacterized protein TNIN_452851 [Trichonephila inaurata madagascariensis]
MNPNDFIDDDVPEESLTSNWNRSSTQVSQPPASLETELQNLSLTAPVSTPEAFSLHSSTCPLPISYKSREDQIQARHSHGWKLERELFFVRLQRKQLSKFQENRERLLQLEERILARISQHRMGSTSSMSSFPGADHELSEEGKYILEYLLI